MFKIIEYLCYLLSNFASLHTDTRFSIGTLLETFIAETMVTPFQVNATSMLTETRVNGAFVDILTLVHRSYLLVPGRTDAHESADQILALKPAVVRWRDAFVHV